MRRARFEGLAARARTVPAAIAAAGFLAVAGIAHFFVDRKIATPWYTCDEFSYADQARYWVEGHRPPALFNFFYPILITPAWWLSHTMATTYGLVKAINVVLMLAGAVVVYVWGRRLAPPLYALAAALLVVVMPTFTYTGMLVSENAFFPFFLLAVFAFALAIEHPTLVRQVAAVAAIVPAVAARSQGVVLPLILVTAVLLDAVLGTRESDVRRWGAGAWRRLRGFWLAAALLAAGALAYVVFEVVRGKDLTSGLGAYSGTVHVHASLRVGLRWVVYQLADLVLAAGIIPAAAFLVVVVLVLRNVRGTTAAERAFGVVAVSAIVWIVFQVGFLASPFANRIQERNTFHVLPLLFLGLVLWLARGAPRPPALTAVALLVPAALLLALPFEGYLNFNIYSDTFSFIPFYRLLLRFRGNVDEVRSVIALGLCVAGLIFLLTSRRFAAPACVGAVALFLLLSSYSVVKQLHEYSLENAAATATGDLSWIDRAVGPREHVGVVYLNSTEPQRSRVVLHQTYFWNRSVRRVYQVGANELCALPVRYATADPVNGHIVPLAAAGVQPVPPPPLVAVASGVELSGKLVASTGTLALYRIRTPLGLASSTEGVYADGWSGPVATYERYVGPRGGRIRVWLSRAVFRAPYPGRIVAKIGRLASRNGVPAISHVTAVKTWTLRGEETHTLTLPAPRAPFRVEVTVTPTFMPAPVGQGDSRELGAKVAFSFVPN